MANVPRALGGCDVGSRLLLVVVGGQGGSDSRLQAFDSLELFLSGIASTFQVSSPFACIAACALR